jgi:hypothetical protein
LYHLTLSSSHKDLGSDVDIIDDNDYDDCLKHHVIIYTFVYSCWQTLRFPTSDVDAAHPFLVILYKHWMIALGASSWTVSFSASCSSLSILRWRRRRTLDAFATVWSAHSDRRMVPCRATFSSQATPAPAHSTSQQDEGQKRALRNTMSIQNSEE